MQWLHSRQSTQWLLLQCGLVGLLVVMPLLLDRKEQTRRMQAEVLSAARLAINGPDFGGEPADRGGSVKSMIDADPHTWWFGRLPGTEPLIIDLGPQEPVRMTQLNISYAENRAPTDLTLEIKEPGDLTFTEVASFKDPKPNPKGITLRIRPPGEGIHVEVIRLKITGAEQPDGIVRIHELRIIEDL